MKPGNLLIQGAKSGGKRQMRIRYFRTSSPTVCGFLLIGKDENYGKEIIYF